MACEKFRTVHFRTEARERIDRINEILDEYQGQQLTARQVYYQFVARGWLDNTPRSYKNLTSLITDARYAGLVDWEAIEDRGREPDVPQEWDSIEGLVATAIRSYRLPRWRGQTKYVELWVKRRASTRTWKSKRSRVPKPRPEKLLLEAGIPFASCTPAAPIGLQVIVGRYNQGGLE